MGEEPAEGEVQDGVPLVVGQGVQGGHLGQPPPAEVGSPSLVPGGQSGATGRSLSRPVLAAEETAGQGEVGQEGGLCALAEGQDLVLGLAVQEVVLVLHADEAGRTVGHGGGGLLEHPPGEVGAAQLADLALGDQFAQRPQRVGDGRLGVGRVQLVEVDVVGAQAAQGVLEGPAHVGRARPTLVALVGAAELGGHHHLVPPGAEGGAEVRLALGPPVDVGGVEQGDAGVERRPNDGAALLLVQAHAEVVAPQPHDADPQRADRACLHWSSLPWGPPGRRRPFVSGWACTRDAAPAIPGEGRTARTRSGGRRRSRGGPRRS